MDGNHGRTVTLQYRYLIQTERVTFQFLFFAGYLQYAAVFYPVVSIVNQLKEWFADDEAVRLYGPDGLEWWLRVHLIVDHVSAMTDDFALFEYQMFEGIRINN